MHFHTLTVLSAFVIYYMCDGSIASIVSTTISLLTGKNEYEINALMKKASIIFKQKRYFLYAPKIKFQC